MSLNRCIQNIPMFSCIDPPPIHGHYRTRTQPSSVRAKTVFRPRVFQLNWAYFNFCSVCFYLYFILLVVRMSASFPTNCSTGSRMRFSWLPMESKSCRELIVCTHTTLLPSFCFSNVIKTKSCCAFRSAEDKQQNPMVQLFYGTFVTERKHEGMSFIWALVAISIIGNSVPHRSHLHHSAQGRFCATLSSLGSTPCRWMASTTWTNV